MPLYDLFCPTCHRVVERPVQGGRPLEPTLLPRWRSAGKETVFYKRVLETELAIRNERAKL